MDIKAQGTYAQVRGACGLWHLARHSLGKRCEREPERQSPQTFKVKNFS